MLECWGHKGVSGVSGDVGVSGVYWGWQEL